MTFGIAPAFAQSNDPDSNSGAGTAMQARIERARALAAAHQLSAAAGELDVLRTTAQDDSIRNVASLMLMSICLEEGNYARAESLLEETFKARQVKKDASIRTYFALAGQAVNGARAHLTRYRNFGINVRDATLPKEALADLDRLRMLLERMSFQAREISKDQPKAYESLALLEDILGIRLSLARDEEDRAKWEGERAGVRQGLVLNQSQVASLGSVPPVTAVLENSPQQNSEIISAPTQPATNSGEASKPTPAEDKKATPPNTVSTGLLNMRATRRVVPVYPQIARNAAAEGIVRVYVTIDERGNVSEIAKSEGPTLLRGAAEDAARRWKFSPTEVGGKLVRLAGYIEFNFTL
ncbi:MAG TPA: energy transducer TonB [Pyrinomonadaceae bacterium]|nr:energy transducer TonB [Pyrinomonadaceae bacterium]